MVVFKHLGFALNLLALCLFFPGILLPMFSLKMEVTAKLASSGLSTDIVNKELSIITTLEELWQDERILVAIMIGLFSIAIPLMKSALMTWSYVCKDVFRQQKLVKFVGSIGKWSMADVFVVAVFLAVLSTNHAETVDKQQISMLAFKFEMLVSSETLSTVRSGFYYFTGYCLLSLLGTHLSHKYVLSLQTNN